MNGRSNKKYDKWKTRFGYKFCFVNRSTYIIVLGTKWQMNWICRYDSIRRIYMSTEKNISDTSVCTAAYNQNQSRKHIQQKFHLCSLPKLFLHWMLQILNIKLTKNNSFPSTCLKFYNFILIRAIQKPKHYSSNCFLLYWYITTLLHFSDPK